MPPRQAELTHTQLVGTSSFGMSGVNAHVILGATDEPLQQPHQQPSGGPGKHLYLRHRLWPLPQPHPMLTSALAARRHAVLACHLPQAALSYLWQQEAMGHATLAASAVFEAMAAAGHLLGGRSGALAALGITLVAPIHLQAGSTTTITCNVELSSGFVQLLGQTQQAAAAALLAPVPALPTLGETEALGPTSSIALAQLTSAWCHAPTSAPPAAVASLQLPAWLQPHGYYCHPALSESAVAGAGAGTANAVLSCTAYLPGTQPAATKPGPVACVAVGAVEALGLQLTGSTAMQCGGLELRPLQEVARRRVLGAPAPPAWQLVWQPMDLLASLRQVREPQGQQDLSCLLLSTHPCTLGTICRPASGRDEVARITALSAAWAPAPEAPAALATAHVATPATEAPPPELCLGSAAHLELLLRSTGVQCCLYVQPAGTPAELPAALAAYQGLLRTQGCKAGIGLVTFDSQDVPGYPAAPGAPAGMLHGELPLPPLLDIYAKTTKS